MKQLFVPLIATLLFSSCLFSADHSSPLMVEAQTSGPRRGMYVSLYADNIGPINLNTATDNLIQFYRVLGDTPKEDEVLQWLQKYHFNAITLYDLHKILISVPLTTALRSFILRARAIGIECVEAATGDFDTDADRVLAFNTGSATDDERFDGLVTEIEFWGSSYVPAQHDTTSWSARVAYAKTLSIPARGANTFYYGAYLGYVDTAGMNTVAAAVDYIMLHSYVSHVTGKLDPTGWYGYTNGRMIDFVATGSSAQIIVLPSFEGDRWSVGTASTSKFQGHTIAHFGLNHCEEAMRTSWLGAGTAPISKLEGFHYYEYVFAKLYMGGTNTQTMTETISAPTTATRAISKTLDAPTPVPPSPAPVTPIPPTPAPTMTTTTTTTAAAAATTASVGTASTSTTTAPATSPPLASTSTTTTAAVNVAPASTVPPTPIPASTTTTSVQQQETNPPAQARGIFRNDDGSTSTTGVVIILLAIGVLTHFGLFVAYQCRKRMTGEGGRGEKENPDN